MIKNMILNAPDFMIIKGSGEIEDNMRTLYDIALIVDDLPGDTKESPFDMIYRAGMCFFSIERALDEIAESLYEDWGLSGGATGSSKMSDIKYLSEENALILFNITYAQLQIWPFKKSVCQAFINYSERYFPDLSINAALLKGASTI